MLEYIGDILIRKLDVSIVSNFIFSHKQPQVCWLGSDVGIGVGQVAFNNILRMRHGVEIKEMIEVEQSSEDCYEDNSNNTRLAGQETYVKC